MSETNSISVIGAGGHTRSLLTLLKHSDFSVNQIFEAEVNGNETINAIEVSKLPLKLPKDLVIVLSIGDNQRRKALFLLYEKQILKNNLIHPSVCIEELTHLGEANQILAKVYINSHVEIGFNNIFNTGCILEHEVKVGNHNHISVGAVLCGRVNIGSGCFVGAGAVVIDKVIICDDVTIGANSVVIESIHEPGVYVGNPARKVK